MLESITVNNNLKTAQDEAQRRQIIFSPHYHAAVCTLCEIYFRQNHQNPNTNPENPKILDIKIQTQILKILKSWTS
ncbi:hypothetical protein [Anabaena sp. WA102]|jgi:hypothetical protein|uniref:hypothetical protein n=1 Tax=Anabaena sp. WA102 TaxID=1647413 RepID=UPI000A968216|nr:hypothetical protein [Anabaena sp. WA102]